MSENTNYLGRGRKSLTGANPWEAMEERGGDIATPQNQSAPSAVTSLPLRSPKRTISFDFPTDMDPQRMQEIHRQIVQMAHEAGTIDSVKIVEEPPRYEEDGEVIPIIHLQDPPKPKFKRQLSADGSPPDKNSHQPSATQNPAGQNSFHQRNQGHLMPLGTVRQSEWSGHSDSALRRPVHRPETGHLTSSSMSPKRLKSEHSGISGLQPRSPLVNPCAAKEQIQSHCEKANDMQTTPKPAFLKQSIHSDVVHIFPKRCEDKMETNENEDNNNMSDEQKSQKFKATHGSSQARHTGDETDSKPQQQRRQMSTGDVVRVFDFGKISDQESGSEKSSATATTAPQRDSASNKPSLNRQESLETLHMLFKTRKDSHVRDKEKLSAGTVHGFDRPQPASVLDPMLSERVNIFASSEASAQRRNNEQESYNNAQTMSREVDQTASFQHNTSDFSVPTVSRENTTDSYLNQMVLRLQEMQRRILFQQMVPKSSSDSVQYSESDSAAGAGVESSLDSNAEDNTIVSSSQMQNKRTNTTPDVRMESDMECDQVTPSSKKSTSTLRLSTGSTSAEQRSSEEESRTARLCRSKENPFKFMHQGTALQSSLKRSVAAKEQPEEMAQSEGGNFYPDNVETMEASPNSTNFTPGDLLWRSPTTDGRGEHLMRQRLLSDPGSVRPARPNVDIVTMTTLRQFSAPGRAQEQFNRKDTDKPQTESLHTGKGLQQRSHGRVRSDSFEMSNTADEPSAFFVGEELTGTRSTKWKGSDQEGLRINRCLSTTTTQSPTETFEFNRRFHSDPVYARQKENLSKDQHKLFSQPYWHQRSQSPMEQMTSSKWSHSLPKQVQTMEDMEPAKPRQAGFEDDSVFEETGSDENAVSPFKSPGTPVGILSYGDHRAGRFWDRLASSRLRSESAPKRPVLRSQSDIEQSPNQAELDAMAHYKYLRSFSEHISDPQRLMEQLRTVLPSDSDQLIEQLQSMRRGASVSPRGRDRLMQTRTERPPNVRRILFPDTEDVTARPEESEDWQQFCHTYPFSLPRRQSFSSARDLRRSRSWIQERDLNAGSMSRPRQKGDMDVRIQCTRALSVPAQSLSDVTTWPRPQPDDVCTRIESYIQQILQNHLQIRPSGTSHADMDLWLAQAQEIEQLTCEASMLISSLDTHNRAVYDVTTGSVIIKLHCVTLLGVTDIWRKYKSGSLQTRVVELFGGNKLLALTGIGEVELKVSMCYHQYLQCLEELGGEFSDIPMQRPRTEVSSPATTRKVCQGEDVSVSKTLPVFIPPRSVPQTEVASKSAQKLRTSSSPLVSPSWTSRSFSTTPKTEGKCLDGDSSARKAFSELNLSSGNGTPPSVHRIFLGSVHKENSFRSPVAVSSSLRHPTGKTRHTECVVIRDNCKNII